jgi:putative DNA methylase
MTDYPIKSPRKLIEVALPLDAINTASAREKLLNRGHPNTLHIWWARRPLAAARAVIFAQLVNDPGYQQGGGFKYGKNKKDAAIERKRLFKIIEDLVLWENTTNEEVLERARAEIRRSWREVCDLNQDHPQATELFNPDKLPGLHDPFAGGGAIPLEAQRLGLDASASDLNPVAVLINKAMLEVPPKFANCPPANPDWLQKSTEERTLTQWNGVSGLAEDVRHYGAWLCAEAQRRIGHLYPPVEVTADMARQRPELHTIVGRKLNVIAWIWARTVKSPNPAFSHVDVPLVSTFMLYTKPGKEAYILPEIKSDSYSFAVKSGLPQDLEATQNGTKLARGSNFRCLMSGTPISGDYIKAEGRAGRMGARLMAIVAETDVGRVFLSAPIEHEAIGLSAKPSWEPEGLVPARLTGGTCVPYGFTTWGRLFTSRQLILLTTISDLVTECRNRIRRDASGNQLQDNDTPFYQGGTGALAYGDAVATFLAFTGSRMADRHSSLCRWQPNPSGYAPKIAGTFGRQALPMVWDYAEGNPFGPASGNLQDALKWIVRVIETSLVTKYPGRAIQMDAQNQLLSLGRVVSTDPPYYNNIGYADLSDFFYVWLRRSLKPIYPDLFSTLAVPKTEELVATPHRHGSKEKAEAFFLTGMTQAMHQIAEQAHCAFPVTIYYAFKQSETDSATGTANTGWETFLDAVLRAGFALTGTWPMRTEMKTRQVAMGSNALASSIVLVCRKRPTDAPSISRREFIRELNGVLPEALDEMTKGSGDERSPVAPVDLSQAIIGPGMAVFSKYAAVLEADGSTMSVRTALQLINRFLAEDDFDADTQFCLHWFEQHGWTEGAFGEALVLAQSKGTSPDGMKEAGVLQSGSGKVRLLKWAEYPTDWDPRTDTRTPVWEALHQLIRALKQGGESASGALLAALGGKAEAVRQLAYRLYTLCERLGQAEDARAYNELITSWTGIESAAATAPKPADGYFPGMEV